MDTTIKVIEHDRLKLETCRMLLEQLKGFNERQTIVLEAIESIDILIYSNSVMHTKDKLNQLTKSI